MSAQTHPTLPRSSASPPPPAHHPHSALATSHASLATHSPRTHASSRNSPSISRFAARRHPMRILTLNAGSSSLKVTLFEQSSENGPVKQIHSKNLKKDHDSTQLLRDYVEQHSSSTSSSASSDHSSTPIRLVVHRIVHGGHQFHAPTLLTPDNINKLEELNSLAPLHNPPALELVHAAIKAFPMTSASSSTTSVQHVAVFDTAFFHQLPEVAQAYALPHDLVSKYHLRRYGFHGLAHQSIVNQLAAAGVHAAQLTSSASSSSGSSGGRMVTLQLGSGCSAAAVLAGSAVETSFGFGPLEGLVMSTRSGDVDPALLTFLQRHDKHLADPHKLEDMLYHKSGLLALSDGASNDMKELLQSSSSSPAAKLAVDVFHHRLLKYVGAYVAVLGGLDVLAFGGGIGEHASEVRNRLVADLSKFLPVQLNDSLNAHPKSTDGGKDAVTQLISSSDSKVQVWLVAVDEASVMVQDALQLTRPTNNKSQL